MQNMFATKFKSSINQQQFNGGVAQLVRARDFKPEVSGSIPLPAANFKNFFKFPNIHS